MNFPSSRLRLDGTRARVRKSRERRQAASQLCDVPELPRDTVEVRRIEKEENAPTRVEQDKTARTKGERDNPPPQQTRCPHKVSCKRAYMTPAARIINKTANSQGLRFADTVLHRRGDALTIHCSLFIQRLRLPQELRSYFFCITIRHLPSPFGRAYSSQRATSPPCFFIALSAAASSSLPPEPLRATKTPPLFTNGRQ